MQKLPLETYVSMHVNGVLEEIAKCYAVPLKQVIDCLPNAEFVKSEYFLTIWQTVQHWGRVMFLLHLNDIILEVETILPIGKLQAGHLNMLNESGLSGHIEISNCQDIVFIERKFMTLDTASIVFLNTKGQAMFKIFVGYDEQYQIIPQQLEQFRALRAQLSTQS